jgi:hypothetical protein
MQTAIDSLIAQPALGQKSPRHIHDTAPLPVGFTLPFFAPFCYSPRGESPLAQKSRRLRDLVKRGDAATLSSCASIVATVLDSEIARDFFNPSVLLIPVPPSGPRPTDRATVPEAIARNLHRARLGAAVWPVLRRHRPIAKSAWCRPAFRPEFLEHCASLELTDSEWPTDRLTLIDDFITRGRTLLSAAAVLHRSLPGAHIRAFALVRTDGLHDDIAAITDPTLGVIRYLGDDAFRSP